jgi:stage V sporulation protein SpoVS
LIELPAIDAGGGQEGQQQHDWLSNRPSSDKLWNQMLQLQSGILSLRHENIELRNDIAALKLIIEIGFATVNGNVRSVAIQPARQQVTTASGMDLLAGAAATGTTVGNEGTTMLAPALAMMNAPP